MCSLLSNRRCSFLQSTGLGHHAGNTAPLHCPSHSGSGCAGTARHCQQLSEALSGRECGRRGSVLCHSGPRESSTRQQHPCLRCGPLHGLPPRWRAQVRGKHSATRSGPSGGSGWRTAPFAAVATAGEGTPAPPTALAGRPALHRAGALRATERPAWTGEAAARLARPLPA